MSDMAQQAATETERQLAELSTLLLDIHRLSRERSLAAFHDAALQRLQQVLPFDKAWWGRAAHIDGRIEEHSFHLFGLAAGFVEDWRSIQHDDVTVEHAHELPGQAVIVDMHAHTSGLRWLGERHGLGELVCVIHTNPLTQLTDHLSLYCPLGARFDDRHRRLLTHLVAHLSAAVDANQIRTLIARRERLTQQQNLALAVCDRHGVLHSAERGFAELLSEEWPDWQGSQLPEGCQPSGYLGRTIRIESQVDQDLFLLTVYRRSPLDCLSARELSVARQLSQGQTYKEIARELGIAPSTVRHHLRSLYQKLDVHDKASVATLLSRTPPG
ncbi:helix-turn-helix transcriptional regulator [Halomonas organivorans]|uniref:DNA-binding CsgD family transcriptional regulator n=1 Tax=Halomonas organivorans TaxID=257772 RepID=A0A7W5BZC8_9GAMM|nr:helix-turn-helix transcriptional regulator [Halomonas organivorans]MBB3141443.1 DNA-binding CsgD family transcriptional regulator [Halomonas organivorans]